MFLVLLLTYWWDWCRGNNFGQKAYVNSVTIKRPKWQFWFLSLLLIMVSALNSRNNHDQGCKRNIFLERGRVKSLFLIPSAILCFSSVEITIIFQVGRPPKKYIYINQQFQKLWKVRKVCVCVCVCVFCFVLFCFFFSFHEPF